MSKQSITERAVFAEDLIRAAGALALSYFEAPETLTIADKGCHDHASQADLETERLIKARIAESWPDDMFLGEETGGVEPAPGQGIWVVDPIDGTSCFIHGMAGWTVSIAWMIDDVIEIGLVFDPVHDALFTARRGQGAKLNGNPIHCGPDTDFSDSMTGIGASHRISPERSTRPIRRLLEEGGMFHRVGSCALSLAYVACGRLNGYYEAHINAWDCHAGLLMVREAGGWSNSLINGEELLTGGEIAACAPGVVDHMRKLMEER